jgi:uncharacterized membrane protein YgcG
MTSFAMFAPILTAGALAVLTTTFHRRLPAKFAARVTVVAVVAVCLAALPTLWIVGLGFLAHVPLVGDGFRWCSMAFGLHGHAPTALALPALMLSGVGAARGWRIWRIDQRLRVDAVGPIEYADDDAAYAVTIPGKGGRIVLSRGLIDLLDESEQAVVVSHERTHARYRHDRYLLIARIAQATCPALRPLTRRLQFSLERWADEAAARHCGDRSLVARTLAKVALATTGPTPSLGFTGSRLTGSGATGSGATGSGATGSGFAVGGFDKARVRVAEFLRSGASANLNGAAFARPEFVGLGLGVAARANALLDEPARQPSVPALVSILGGIAATGVLAAVQLHHLGPLLAVLCHS